ncbi:MAG: hypothetical protein ACYTHJ_18145 [Planctomycetota bacterium]|jgi:hypothetical protein
MKSPYLIIMLLLAGLIVGGCKKKEPAPPSPDQAAQIKAQLAKADAIDGSEDKTVSRCAVCKLGMDGSDEHVLSAHGYSLRFCADRCKTQFGKNIDESILAMKIPDK